MNEKGSEERLSSLKRRENISIVVKIKKIFSLGII